MNSGEMRSDRLGERRELTEHLPRVEVGEFTCRSHHQWNIILQLYRWKTGVSSPTISPAVKPTTSGAHQKGFAEEVLLHGFLQLLVPEAEDNGAEEGCEDCVGDAHQGVPFQRLGTLGLEVDHRGEAIVHNHHSEVGRTCGESLMPALSRGDPQDGSHDAGIGQEDEEAAAQQGSDAHQAHALGHIWYIVTTGQLQQRWYMTSKMVDLIGSTEGEVKNGCCHHQPHNQATYPRPGHQAGTATGTHEHIVAQRVADGHVAVVAHDREQEGVGEAKREGEEHLAGTGLEGNGVVGGEQVGQHARDDGEGVEDLRDREGTQEEVHGCVEAALTPDGDHDE